MPRLMALAAQQHNIFHFIRSAQASGDAVVVLKAPVIILRALRSLVALPATQGVPQVHQKADPIGQGQDFGLLGTFQNNFFRAGFVQVGQSGFAERLGATSGRCGAQTLDDLGGHAFFFQIFGQFFIFLLQLSNNLL